MGRRRRTKNPGARGLGARYGSTVRKRYGKIISEMRMAHKCPQCSLKSVHRESVGIWRCKKCGLTFTGGAYTPNTKLGVEAKRAAS